MLIQITRWVKMLVVVLILMVAFGFLNSSTLAHSSVSRFNQQGQVLYGIPCEVNENGNWAVVRDRRVGSDNQKLVDLLNGEGVSIGSPEDPYSHYNAIDLNDGANNVGPRPFGICQNRRVLAARDGVISHYQNEGRCGNVIRIQHSGGQVSLYCHLPGINVSMIGRSVKKGDYLSEMGDSGYGVTGVHVHFAVFTNGQRDISKWDFENPFARRSGKMDFNGDGKPDIFAILKNGGASGRVEAHIMNGADNYQSFLAQIATTQNQGASQANWAFTTGDYNGDGRPDLYLVAMSNTSSGKVEVSILNGADSYQSFLGRIVLPQGQSGPNDVWSFAIGDYNGDGRADLYLIAMTGTASGRVEAHIFNGADSYQSTLTRVATAQNPTGPDDVWSFAIGDYNGDGRPDIYLITFYKTGTGKVEAHILSGADGYQSFLGHIPTAQNQKSPNDIWSFVVDDYNGDGRPDIYLINKSSTGTGKVEAHIMDGSNNYQIFFGHIPTTLGQVAPNCSWDFLGGRCVSGPVIGWIDSPRPNSAIFGVSPVSGWAKVENSTISRVEVWVDGVKCTDAAYGLPRADAGGNFGWQWYWDTKSIVNGPHSLLVKAIGANGKESVLLNSADHLSPTNITVQNRSFFADVNGDGRADAITVETTGVYVSLSTGSRFGARQLWTERPFYGQRGTFFADVDGDRKADIIVVNNNFITVRRSTGTAFAYEQAWTENQYIGSVGSFFADVNGDGRADAIVVNDATINNRVTVRLSTGSSFGPNQDWTTNFYYGARGNYFADVNGDGRADAIVVNDTTINNRITVRRSTGSFFADNQDWTIEPFYGTQGTFFADVNGDGPLDAIAVNDSRITVKTSVGTSFTPSSDWTTDPFYGNQGTFFADVNGDRLTDAISARDGRLLVRLSTAGSFAPALDWTPAL